MAGKNARGEGRTFIYLADEFYFLAGREVPPATMYDGFPQLDNGIGLTRSFIGEWDAAKERGAACSAHLAVVSGTAVAPVLAAKARELDPLEQNIFRHARLKIVIFGAMVNVSGLLIGADIAAALREMPRTVDGVLIPASACARARIFFWMI